MRFPVFVGILFGVLSVSAPTQSRMSPELLWQLGRLSGGSISPDGKHALYGVKHYELEDNKGDSDLFVVNLETGQSRKLTDEASSESSPQWVKTPAGLRVFFVARRGAESDEEAVVQVWSMDPAEGSITQVTASERAVANLKVAPTGNQIAVTIDVKLDPTVQDLYPDLPEADARIIDGLLYRHWDSWHDYTYSHVFVAELNQDGTAGELVDLMEGLKFNCPVPPFGGSEQFNWSSDGSEIAYTMKVSNNPAESTDTDVFVQESSAGAKSLCLTTGMDGYDMEPSYSPDGQYLAFQSMRRPGFESDRNRIMIVERTSGKMFELTEGLDQTTHDIHWAPDSKALYFRSERRGTDQLFRVELKSRQVQQVTEGQYNFALRDVGPGGKLLISRQSMLRPWELGIYDEKTREFRQLTNINGELYAELELPRVEPRWVRASDGKSIHSWVIYPPDFDPEIKWPLLVYCQGGPQGQIGQWFSYRWNFHVMAAQGYVVIAPNRRGLPGFGREWNDQISGDWGGQAMQDILAATDSMLTEAYVDGDRVAAIGASFGGYTVFWLMGNHNGRFKTMIAHAGLYNLESFYGATEELFFPNFDIGGPYWESNEWQREYDFHSPHRYVANWDRPILIVHGENDFRVPVTQAMEAFTAAKLKGLQARFLYYPEEGHWILEPQNGVLWHRIFFDWLKRHLDPAGS